MSFSNFGGFGAANNQQQNQSPFGGGFGAQNTNTTPGFGATGTSGFGTTNNNAGGSLFGGGGNNTGGFGSTGFGSSTTSGFGARPAFGATAATSASPFGGGTSTTTGGFGGGGFGNTTNNQPTSGFGGTSSGLFGASNNQTQTAGFGTSTGGGLFGGGQASAFGQPTSTTPAFGQAASTAFGTNQSGVTAQNTGTANTQYSPFIEKDSVGSGTQHFQSITCMPVYANFSFEELRAVDYNQGRKYANQGGQPGAFGQSTGFGGGFGSTNPTSGFGQGTSGGMFGAAQNQSTTPGFGTTSNTGFGTNNAATSAFGAKPATGLFGSAPASTSTTTSGLFGTSNNTGFGTTTTSGFGNTTGTGLFGANNNQPKTGLFGAATATGTGFGSNTTGGLGQIASNTGTGLFGNQTQQQSGGFGQPAAQNTPSFGGGFGQSQPQQSTGFGTTTNNSFGQAAQQPTKSLFGTPSNTLFGQQQTTQQPSNGLFGSQPAQQQNNGFGQSAQKPGLFGNTTGTTNTGTGLFGNNNNNTTTTGNGLFGQTNNNNQSTGLFGQPPKQNTGTNNLFGSFGQSNNNNNNQNGLVGQSNASQQLGFGSSFMNNSQQQQQQQQPQQLTTSIGAPNPYGNEHLFVSLATPQQAVGPLATPLSSSQKPRARAPLPQYRINPGASSRLLTPQRKNGFGFEYSTYGTPGSAFSSASPMYSRSLMGGGSLNRSLGRSLSTSNLRASFSNEDSILAPGAFTAGGMRSTTSGSLRKLKINRSLRTDLFGADGNDTLRQSPLKKTVSFENNTTEKNSPAQNDGESSTALVRVDESESPTPSAEEQGYIRSSSSSSSSFRRKSTGTNGATPSKEMEQVRGNELAIVPEDETPAPPVQPAQAAKKTAADVARLNQNDMEPGDYYMIPTRAELEKMSRKRLSNVSPFTVGRENAGMIEFDKVDLSNVNLKDICGGIVKIEIRTATVYADSAVRKPKPGEELNFPAKVTLDNSWPRAKGGKLPVFERKGPRFEKHLERLKRVGNTVFINYDVETGQWVFRVEHFSTYTLEYSDDESMLSAVPSTGRGGSSGLIPAAYDEDFSASEMDSNPDDTFEFRNSARSNRMLPGAFSGDVVSDEEMEDSPRAELRQTPTNRRISQNSGSMDTFHSSIFDDVAPAQSSSKQLDAPVASLKKQTENDHLISPIKNTPAGPKSILKNSIGVGLEASTRLNANHMHLDWASKLQHTLSPKKQDRQALRQTQGQIPEFKLTKDPSAVLSKEANPFATSVDIMNSLFGGQPKTNGGREVNKQGASDRGFQWPYAKRQKASDISDSERAFHRSFKPSWASDGTFIHPSSRCAATGADNVTTTMAPVISSGRDVSFERLRAIDEAKPTATLRLQRGATEISLQDRVPLATTAPGLSFDNLAEATVPNDSTTSHEKSMWQLASLLFDPLEDDADESSTRKTKVSQFWQKLVEPAAKRAISLSRREKKDDSEEIALLALSGHDVWTAVENLMVGKNFRLATLIAQLEGEITGGEAQRKAIDQQIDAWRKSNDLADFVLVTRALYELVAGNTCVSIGHPGPGAENRAENFNISARFSLDWRRTFGLKLWYGISSTDPLPVAIERYVRDLASYQETVRPVPWFREEKVNTGWEDAKAEDRQDILLGLLKLYALKEEGEAGYLHSRVNLADTISPLNLSGNPVDNRLSFQLYRILVSHGVVDFSDDVEEVAHKSDILTMDYAFQLSFSPANLVDALFVTLHLSEATSREAAIKALLDRHAAVIGESAEACPVFGAIFNDLKIPAPWIWQAKALHAQALRQDIEQCRCLIKANDLEQAHKVLCDTVAPRCVIEEDRRGLLELLQIVEVAGASTLKSWSHGGAVYRDYLRLMQIAEKGGDAHEGVDLAKRLLEKVVLPEGSGILNVRVAGDEMRRGVEGALMVLRRRIGDDAIERLVLSKTLATDNALLNKVSELSDAYYKKLVAA